MPDGSAQRDQPTRAGNVLDYQTPSRPCGLAYRLFEIGLSTIVVVPVGLLIAVAGIVVFSTGMRESRDGAEGIVSVALSIIVAVTCECMALYVLRVAVRAWRDAM